MTSLKLDVMQTQAFSRTLRTADHFTLSSAVEKAEQSGQYMLFYNNGGF